MITIQEFYMLFWTNPRSSKQPTKKQLYGYVLSISQTIQVDKRDMLSIAGKSKDELKSDIILWTPTQEHTSFDRLARIYKH